MRIRQLWSLLKEAADSWSEDKVPRLAAALSYYTLFSIAPLVVVAMAVAGMFYGEDAARGQIAVQIRKTVGPVAAEAIQGVRWGDDAEGARGAAGRLAGRRAGIGKQRRQPGQDLRPRRCGVEMGERHYGALADAIIGV